MMAVRVYVISVFDLLDKELRGKYIVHIGSIYNCRFMSERIEEINNRNEIIPKSDKCVPTTMTNIDAALIENFQ